jgi:outer membrane receptor protein involved in Fe transport
LNNLTTGNYLLIVPYNAQTPSKVYGFEFEHQANLNFLPGYLQFVTLSYNFSIIKSESYLLTTRTVFDTIIAQGEFGPVKTPVPRTVLEERKQRFEGQPEFFCNVSLGYDIGNFSGRMSLYYQSEYNSAFSANSQRDEVRGSYTKLDIAVKQKITPNISLLFNANNVLDMVEDRFSINRIDDWRRLTSSERYGPTVDLGVRLDF